MGAYPYSTGLIGRTGPTGQATARTLARVVSIWQSAITEACWVFGHTALAVVHVPARTCQ
jgi:hypothetical protein